MPYIPKCQRKALDPHINNLVAEILMDSPGVNDFAGPLNYVCTSLALRIVRRKFGPVRYWIIAMLCGVFGNVAAELYRRVGVPYEDKQIEMSGDLAEFEEKKYG